MKIILFLVFSILILRNAFADEGYAVEKSDGSVDVITYLDGSGDSLETILKERGLTGRPVKRVGKIDLPDGKSDRVYWQMNSIPIGKKVIVDTIKKTTDDAAKQAKEARKQTLLKMTTAEYQEAKDLGLFR